MLKTIISIVILSAVFLTAVKLCLRAERKRREAMDAYIRDMDVDLDDFDIPYWDYVGRDVEEDEI